MGAIITVSELNKYLKAAFDADEVLRNISVTGEISNFTNHYKTGHFYFSLKDDKSVVRTVMFAGNAGKLKFVPENGMKVIVTGRVAVFERDGSYQLYAETMEPDGIGALYVAYEQLKSRLEAEGLFNTARKRPIPRIPNAIGVITSPTGAAVRDIINIVTRRFPLAKIILYPTLVQGTGAPVQLISGLTFFNRRKNVDTIILGRGGGSIEELWAFNDEGLARAIYGSNIPVISAVGHETDFTIADFVADLRAPTPSAAAEISVPDSIELQAHIANLRHKAEILMFSTLNNSKNRIAVLAGKKALTSPGSYLDDRRMELLRLTQMLSDRSKSLVDRAKNKHQLITAKLHSMSPLAVIARGYSMATKNGEVLTNLKNVNVGDRIDITLSDGSIDCNVIEKRVRG